MARGPSDRRRARWIQCLVSYLLFHRVLAIDLIGCSALAFWLLEGPADQAIAWLDYSAADQQALLDSYHAAGISLVVSAFGSTDEPATSGADPTTTANNLAAWVIANNLDGVDVGKCIIDLAKVFDLIIRLSRL